MCSKLRIGSRDSALAMRQSELVRDAILRVNPELDITILPMKTTGDRLLNTPLDLVGGRGLFTKELEYALVCGDCDLTVHSLKDMTIDENSELPVIAYTDREDPRDVLVLRKYLTVLPEKAIIGTSSKRRMLQAKQLFPNAVFRGIRGNINTRLNKLDSGEYDAVIIAAAGLIRLGLEERISRYFDFDEILPSACQGIMSVQCRKDFKNFQKELSAINNKTSEIIAKTERLVVQKLGGGCTSPNCAYAEITDNCIHIKGLFYNEESGTLVKAAVEGKTEDAELLAGSLAEKLMKKQTPGKVYLLGAGPGDPSLMTIKGKRLLEQADVIISDALIGDSILSMIPAGVRVLNVGKRKGWHSKTQDEINQLLVEEAEKGGIIVRLKGGDPFVFGRGGEEAMVLKAHGIPYEIVPGVTSAVAVPAYAGIPVTQRGIARSFTILTAHTKNKQDAGDLAHINFEALVNNHGTICFLMGFEAVEKIVSGLMKAGMRKDMPCAVISQGTTSAQKTLISTIECISKELENSDLKAPAVFLVGEACAMSDNCQWIEELPLFGKRIIVTRPSNQSENICSKLRNYGAEVLNDPAIIVSSYKNDSAEAKAIAEALDHIERYDWIVLTSPCGADFFAEALKAQNVDFRKLANLKIAVVGNSSAKALKRHGLIADFVPESFYTEALAKGLCEKVEAGQRVLLLRASNASVRLTEILKKENIAFDDISLYQSRKNPATMLTERIKEHILENSIDYCIFTSAYSVECFEEKMNLSEEDKKRFTAVCIGRETQKKAAAYGFLTLVSEEPTEESLIKLILFSGK